MGLSKILFCLLGFLWPILSLASFDCELNFEELDILQLKRSDIALAQNNPDTSKRFSELAKTLVWLHKKSDKFYLPLVVGLRQHRYNSSDESFQRRLSLVQEVAREEGDLSILSITADMLSDVPHAPYFGESFQEFESYVHQKIPEVIHEFLEENFDRAQGLLLAMASENWELISGARPRIPAMMRILRERVKTNYKQDDYKPMLMHFSRELFKQFSVSYYSRLQSLQVDPAPLISAESLRFAKYRFDGHFEKGAFLAEILAKILIPGQDLTTKNLKKLMIGRLYREIHGLIDSLPKETSSNGNAHRLVIENRVGTKGPSPQPGQKRRDRHREHANLELVSASAETLQTNKVELTPIQRKALDDYYKHFSNRDYVFKGAKAMNLLTKLFGLPRNNASSHYVFKFPQIEEHIVVLDLHSWRAHLDPERSHYVHTIVERFAAMSDYRDTSAP